MADEKSPPSALTIGLVMVCLVGPVLRPDVWSSLVVDGVRSVERDSRPVVQPPQNQVDSVPHERHLLPLSHSMFLLLTTMSSSGDAPSIWSRSHAVPSHRQAAAAHELARLRANDHVGAGPLAKVDAGRWGEHQGRLLALE